MFRFTIRDMLWLTALVALAVGWWVEHRTIVAQRDSLDAERKSLKLERDQIQWNEQQSIQRIHAQMRLYDKMKNGKAGFGRSRKPAPDNDP